MIVEAKYVGPYPEVLVPGFERKICKRGETTKIRVDEGVSLGGCWEIISTDSDPAALTEPEALLASVSSFPVPPPAADPTDELANSEPDAAAADLKQKGD